MNEDRITRRHVLIIEILLAILLSVLKVGGAITWSWWWVLSPLWLLELFGLILVVFGTSLSFLFKTVATISARFQGDKALKEFLESK